MHGIAHIRLVRVMLLVAAWRGLTELVVRQRALRASGELQRRVAQRRAARVEAALVRAGVRAPGLVRVRVPVVAIDGRVHSSVQVGAVHGSDLDDVGLLEQAMRRATARPPLVTYVDDRPDAHGTDWGEMLGEEHVVERAWRVVGALGALPLLAMVVGVAMTFVPLVRPLHAMAPWLAIGGLALVAAGVLGARWSERRSGDDLDDDELLDDV